MLRIALTGGIACGKSLVGSFLQELGIPVCDTDHLAHQAMAPGQPAYEEVVDHFGRSILDEDGCIDRRRLGRQVFRDASAREALNAIVHPRVRSAWEGWLREREADGTRVAVVMVPLLFEARVASGWDRIVCVTSTRAIQLERLSDRGLSPEAAEDRLAAQWPTDRKAGLSDCVVTNNGTVEELKQRTRHLVETMLET